MTRIDLILFALSLVTAEPATRHHIHDAPDTMIRPSHAMDEAAWFGGRG